MNKNLLLTLVALGLLNAAPISAAETVLVESRKADGSVNSPAWTAVSGTWGKSKNKSRVKDTPSMVATNVSICTTNMPAPAFTVAPELESGVTYKVDVTFGTSKTQIASADLVVSVAVTGVSANTIPTKSPAFQEANANSWTTLGNITTSTNRPTLTFTYVGGTLSPTSRWYAEVLRFTPQKP